jgi:hypothetical protein
MNKDHWLKTAKLPCKAVHVVTKPKSFSKMKWVYETEHRDVTVSAIDTHGAIVRRKSCVRYYAPFEVLEKPDSPALK